MEREELSGWLRLTLTPEVGNTAARKLLAAFGLPNAVFSAGQDALRAVVTERQVRALQQCPAGFEELLQTTWPWLQEQPAAGERRILTLADSDYPAGLLNTADPPLVLYLAGQLQRGWPRAIAIVGSRNPTPQGLLNARQFAGHFVKAGMAVVSGLALGVDGAAHEGALQACAADQLATIAVVGTGLDRVYPRQHLALAHSITQRGLLVSEYPLGTPPVAANFPRRNRIIAALSEGTLVVEAALQSGSLITARQAAEQGRDVFAIPGSIHSPQARGCHALLKQGAKLVETAQDVLEELRPSAQVRHLAEAEGGGDEREGCAQVSDAVTRALGFDPVSLDALVGRTGMPAAQLQARLLDMELAGELGRLPGGLFVRVGAG